MEPGDIVEFFEDKRIFLGLVLELKGEKLHVLTQNSREMTLAPKRVMHVGPRLTGGSLSRQEILERLEETARKREALKKAIDLEELWGLLAEEGQTVTVKELTDLWFGHTDPDQVAAASRKLREDRFLFKEKDGTIIPNPAETVAQLKEQHLQELERHREAAEIGAWLKAAAEGKAGLPVASWGERVLGLLRQLALWGAEAPDYAQGKAYLDQAGLNAKDGPFRLLVRLGIFSEDEHLDLHRLEAPVEFPPEVIIASRQLNRDPAPDPYAVHRRDLSALPAVTIDGERTRDFDDALSLEEVNGGWRLGIHIADVSALVHADTVVDAEARERGTSIYLPEHRLPMLPEEISEDSLSLLAGEPRRALSFLVSLSPDAELRDWEMVPSLIAVKRRLTYQEVDSILEAEAMLEALSHLTRRLQERRLAQGGYELKLPEVWVNFSPEGDLQVVVEDQETKSHQLVAEAMVLANSLVARFLSEQKIAALYRTQAEPREPIRTREEKNLLELWQDRRRLSRVVMDLTAAPHWGLGLPAYTFATSPIRRYLDLVIHRQLLPALCGQEPAYSREALEGMLPSIEAAMRRAGILKTRRLRYWLLKYLAGRTGQKKEALVLESLPHRYRLIFPDLLLELFLAAPAGRKLIPGDTVLVRLDRVVPREDQIKVSLA